MNLFSLPRVPECKRLFGCETGILRIGLIRGRLAKRFDLLYANPLGEFLQFPHSAGQIFEFLFGYRISAFVTGVDVCLFQQFETVLLFGGCPGKSREKVNIKAPYLSV